MAEIIQFNDRKGQASPGNSKIIKKLVDGEIVECTNFDALTATQQLSFLSRLSDEHRD
jgi:hypothetical protein